MRTTRLSNVMKVFNKSMFRVVGTTTFGCYSGVIPPAASVNPSSLTFADAQSPPQQVTVSGKSGSTNAGNPGTQCFSLSGTSVKGSSTEYTVAPQAGSLDACWLEVMPSGAQAALIPITVGVQTPLGTPVTYEASFSGVNATTASLKSENPGVASVPASATPVFDKTLGEYVSFTITPNAIGTTVIDVYENGANQPPTFSVPVSVTTGSGPSPSGNTFTLANAASQTFSLVGSPVAAQVAFFGQVTVSGASSESVSYSEEAGVPTGGCAVSGTIVDAITLTFPKAFTFAPNGSFGPNTGLLDTLFTPPSPSGTYYGTLYASGSCSSPFDAAAQAISSPPSSYEYPGGGNTSVPAGTYILELWH